jgi:hypothetical protein
MKSKFVAGAFVFIRVHSWLNQCFLRGERARRPALLRSIIPEQFPLGSLGCFAKECRDRKFPATVRDARGTNQFQAGFVQQPVAHQQIVPE